jgi:hypothetical protein
MLSYDQGLPVVTWRDAIMTIHVKLMVITLGLPCTILLVELRSPLGRTGTRYSESASLTVSYSVSSW